MCGSPGDGHPPDLHSRGHEPDVAPFFGPVHIDDSLRRPDPIVLAAGQLLVMAVRVDFGFPFYAGEIDAPLIAALGTPVAAAIAKGAPGKRQFYRPAAISVTGVVQ